MGARLGEKPDCPWCENRGCLACGGTGLTADGKSACRWECEDGRCELTHELEEPPPQAERLWPGVLVTLIVAPEGEQLRAFDAEIVNLGKAGWRDRLFARVEHNAEVVAR